MGFISQIQRKKSKPSQAITPEKIIDSGRKLYITEWDLSVH